MAQLRQEVPIGEERQYLIDVFPVGHVFLPGHELVVKVHAPIVPMDQVRGFEAPAGQCPYASMRCLPGG